MRATYSRVTTLIHKSFATDSQKIRVNSQAIRKVHIDIFAQFAVNSQAIRKRFAKSLIRIHVIRKQFADRSQLIRKIAKAGSQNSHLSLQVIRKFTAMGSRSFLKWCGRCARRVRLVCAPRAAYGAAKPHIGKGWPGWGVHTVRPVPVRVQGAKGALAWCSRVPGRGRPS